MAAPTSVVDTVVSLCKRRGFVFPCGEIYGGTRSAWDYGPLGVELKENIKRQWWKAMVQQRDDMVGLDSSVILPRQVWEASGHVDTFTDPLTECQSCHKRFRADHLQEEVAERTLHMLAGAMDTLRIGDPADPATDVGPVIDRAAYDRLMAHREAMRGRWLHTVAVPEGGLFVPPTTIRIDGTQSTW